MFCSLSYFLFKDTHVNPEVYKALTMHAAKVLTVPASKLKLQDYNNEGPQYVNVSKKFKGFIEFFFVVKL